MRKLGLEGVIAKRIGSHYEPGDRSGAWVKHRLNQAQEFVIGGYVPGARGFDALLVGIYENKHLLFVAKVKNGFVAGLRDKIFSLLEKRRVTHCPFKNLPEKKGSRRGESLTAENMKRCRWIKPELVCEVEFVEWTDAGHLRHSTFIAHARRQGACGGDPRNLSWHTLGRLAIKEESNRSRRNSGRARVPSGKSHRHSRRRAVARRRRLRR